MERVEDWYYVNVTGDTHPMHTHLFTFKVMGRYKFDAAGYAAAYPGAVRRPPAGRRHADAVPEVGLLPPAPGEAGFKDTVKANPGQVTVVRAKFALPSTALDATDSSSRRRSTCTTATSWSTRTTT